jgi:hypothetical protein|tara:strand:+ start:2300 stop:2740 length:441 start_codon:yes stop_codon:yes gene_type:complete
MTTYLLLFSLLIFNFNDDIEQVVKEFHELTSEETELNFINTYFDSNDPSIMGYVTTISMKQAEYSQNPFRKLQLFEVNRDRLNLLIEENSTNIHLRYVRLISQESTPFFLGYNDSIEEDKLILKKILEVEDETDYLDYFIRANTSL